MTGPEGGGGGGSGFTPDVAPVPDVTGDRPQAPEDGEQHPDVYQQSAGLEESGPFGAPGATEGDIYQQAVVPDDKDKAPPAPPEQISDPKEKAAAASPDAAPAPAQPAAKESGLPEALRQLPPDVRREVERHATKMANVGYERGQQDAGGGDRKGKRGDDQPDETPEEAYKREQQEMKTLNDATELAKKRLDPTYVPNNLADLRAQQQQAVEYRSTLLNYAANTRDRKQQEQYKQIAQNLERWVSREGVWLLDGPSDENAGWGDAQEGLYVAGNGKDWPGMQWVGSSKKMPYYRLDKLRDEGDLVEVAKSDTVVGIYTPTYKDPETGELISLMPSCLNDCTYNSISHMGARIRQLVAYGATGESRAPEQELQREVIRKAVALDKELRAEMESGKSTRPDLNPNDPKPPESAPDDEDGGEDETSRALIVDETNEEEEKTRKKNDADAESAPAGSEDEEDVEEEPSALERFINHVNEVADSETASGQERLALLREIDGDPLDPHGDPGVYKPAREETVRLLHHYFEAPSGDDAATQKELQQRQKAAYGAVDEIRSLILARSNLAYKTQGGELITPQELQDAVSAMETDATDALRDSIHGE